MTDDSVVLVVDDDPLNVKLLIGILESDYEHMKTFPGTLGDGNMIVMRSKS